MGIKVIIMYFLIQMHYKQQSLFVMEMFKLPYICDVCERTKMV